MGFLDEAVITVASGDGGHGCVSFRKEKYIPKGGPDGGNGGNGGNVLLRAATKHHSLNHFSSRKHLRARNGGPGKGKNQTGKNGADLILEVPTGTLVHDAVTDEVICDLIHDRQEVLLLAGGKGGKGNRHFATSTHRAPRFAQPGIPGQERKIRLSLRLLADIGLIGMPNTGKSTLLSCLSVAHPKVGDYPFTTLTPNLGVLKFDDGNAVTIADIPGLIEGAGQGRGLGHRFLKHIERTRLLLHLIDITYKPKQEILEDYLIIREEMRAFGASLDSKPQMVLISKMDLYGPDCRDIKKLKKALDTMGITFIPISAFSGEGIDKLREMISVSLEQTLSKGEE